MDKQIIYDCPHVSFTDWGTYACRLYDPRDKNCLVEGGNCDSNISCPYKQVKRKEQECEELKEKVESYVCSTNCYKYKEAEAYKQAIEKIKNYCNKYPQNSIGFKQQILQICDEVTSE